MKFLIIIVSIISYSLYAQCDSEAVFSETEENSVCTEVIDNVRYIYSNNIPDHGEGTLNGGFTLEAQEDTWTMCAYPVKGDEVTQLYGDDSQNGCSNQLSYRFGVGTNGIHYAPSSREYFQNPDTDEYNYEWNVEAVEALGVNNQGAHLNAKGEYHYHAIAEVYFTGSGKTALGIDGTEFSPIVAYAADGYPVYYKYAYTNANDASSGIAAFDSGWSLKSGNRPGDGITAPDGAYDGYYVEDYEFDENATDLDECNGRFGVTPDYPDGTYYYVLTDSWPWIPRCFSGSHVDESFLIGSASSCPDSSADTSCSQSTLDLEESFFETVSFTQVGNELLIKGVSKEDTKLIMYDSLGNLITQEQNDNKISIKDVVSGVYFVQVTYGQQKLIKKIVL